MTPATYAGGMVTASCLLEKHAWQDPVGQEYRPDLASTRISHSGQFMEGPAII